MPAGPTVDRSAPQDAHRAQTAQMSSFHFMPPQQAQRESQRNFVFVDEHNRHKRLKVMRACEACRKRKIKCDAATSNKWPCSSCQRLKSVCIKPNGYEGSDTTTAFDTLNDPSAQYQQLQMADQTGSNIPHALSGIYQGPFDSHNPGAFHPVSFDADHGQHDMNYTTLPTSGNLGYSYIGHSVVPTTPVQQGGVRQESSPSTQFTDPNPQQDLADLMGGLKVNEIGTAPYLRNQALGRRQEQPAIEEEDDDYSLFLPKLDRVPGGKIRIPPSLMPDESTALRLFELYFDHVHPWVPVLDKVTFYHQWNNDREAISPLILEAIFAIGGRLAEEPAMGQQWLALAHLHFDAFMRGPRLSTLQALMILLKAREAFPKDGYFYRSWTRVVQCAQVGRDLGLDEHFEDHQRGIPCTFSRSECRTRTRVWQSIFVCETMIGGPQGRTDLTVRDESVDFSLPSRNQWGDNAEYEVSRNFIYLARLVRNIRKMSATYAKLKRTQDWAVNPEFQQIEQDITAFYSDLPADMAMTYPSDGSPPYLPSSFLGHFYSYFYLSKILYHRPVLSCLDVSKNEVEWKRHMLICYDSARKLCRLQEAVLNTYGLAGLQSMQRGLSFTLYAGLSCIVIHLVAITSPDPDLNTDARDFFQRHMRLVETAMEAWPMPEIREDVDAFREAFSADIQRPFVLKPSFPYGSPHSSNQSDSPLQGTLSHAGSMDHHLDPPNQHVSHLMLPVTPPISVGPMDSRGDSPAAQPLVMMPHNGRGSELHHQNLALGSNTPTWNPARIFEQWNTSFGPPQSHSSPLDDPTSQASLNLTPSPGVPDQSCLTDPASARSLSPATGHLPQQPYSAPTSAPSFITSAMWQESVASVYEGGLKRSWDYNGTVGGRKRR